MLNKFYQNLFAFETYPARAKHARQFQIGSMVQSRKPAKTILHRER